MLQAVLQKLAVEFGKCHWGYPAMRVRRWPSDPKSRPGRLEPR
jgi:hypothetical protein